MKGAAVSLAAKRIWQRIAVDRGSRKRLQVVKHGLIRRDKDEKRPSGWWLQRFHLLSR